MNRVLSALLLILLLAGCAAPAPSSALNSPAGPYDPAQGWIETAPERQGMDPTLLEDMRSAVKQRGINLDSLLVVRSGAIVFEEYYGSERQTSRHVMYSVTKSFTSTLLGVALDQGLLSGTDARVLDLLADDPPADADNPAKLDMTVEHLLTMTTGFAWVEGDPAYRAMYTSPNWVRYMLNLPVEAQPGTTFNYCSGCSHVLMGVVAQQVGMDATEFAEKYLFEPLGIRDYTWETDAQGIPIGGWGLHITARDMAKFGYLFLHEGQWDGKQIVSAEWVKAATSRQVDESGRLDYGYQWWVDEGQGAFAALGRGGQMIYVVPALDLIVVTTADMNGNHDPLFALIDEFIIPAVVD